MGAFRHMGVSRAWHGTGVKTMTAKFAPLALLLAGAALLVATPATADDLEFQQSELVQSDLVDQPQSPVCGGWVDGSCHTETCTSYDNIKKQCNRWEYDECTLYVNFVVKRCSDP